MPIAPYRGKRISIIHIYHLINCPLHFIPLSSLYLLYLFLTLSRHVVVSLLQTQYRYLNRRYSQSSYLRFGCPPSRQTTCLSMSVKFLKDTRYMINNHRNLICDDPLRLDYTKYKCPSIQVGLCHKWI